MRRASFLAILFAFVFCLSIAPSRAQDSKLAIIDVHTHTFDWQPVHPANIPYSEKRFLQDMKKAGVIGAASLTREYDDGYVDDLRKNHNVIYCAGIQKTIRPDLLEEGLKSGKYGCIKIYLGYVRSYAYDSLYEPVYKLAEKYDVPVVFHAGDTYLEDAKLKYADPLTIDEVAVDHRKVRFVIAHCGNPWIESAAEVAYKNPNVYLDGSAFMIGNLSKVPQTAQDQYIVRPLAWIFGYVDNPAKLMYGSDWPLADMSSYIVAFKRAIPPQHWQAVFHDNAVRVFKFKN